MQLPILLVKKNSLFGTIPPEERRTLELLHSAALPLRKPAM